MAEDFEEIEAMLDAPLNKNNTNGDFTGYTRGEIVSSPKDKRSLVRKRSKSREKRRSRSRHRSRSRDKDPKRRSRSRDKTRNKRSKSRGHDKERSKSKGRDKDRSRVNHRDRSRSKRKSRSPRRRSRSRDRKRSSHERRSSRDRERRSSRDRRRSSRDRRTSRDRERRRRSPTPSKPWARRRSPPPRRHSRGASAVPPPPPPPEDELTIEERDARTIFCIQLHQKVKSRDLEEFFSSVGKVRDVRLITCNKTRRFKGIAYIEFKDPESVPLALGLSGQKLLGIPILVQHTQAEKNRMGNSMPNMAAKGMTGPMRLYVGSLHFNITESMLKGIFEPFGRIESIQLMMDTDTGRSKGYGFITFHNAEDAKKALEQLNGYELAGRPMKVGTVTERMDLNSQSASILDSDELDRSGIDLGATGRLQLMFKLAEGAGLQVPPAAASALSMTANAGLPVPSAQTPPIATQCFMLSNMFDPVELSAQDPNWNVEIRDDVIEECNKHGGVLHVFVDKLAAQGNVYVKCPTIATAVASVNSLHGRWFAGRIITAAYVPLLNYHSLFPDAMAALQLLLPSRKSAA